MNIETDVTEYETQDRDLFYDNQCSMGTEPAPRPVSFPIVTTEAMRQPILVHARRGDRLAAPSSDGSLV